MTNKERYQRTFSKFHASEDCIREVKLMKRTNRFHLSKLTALCAAVVMILALASVAYAADAGGIQRSVQIWLYGDQTDAVLVVENGHYTLTYEDENGEPHQQSGGGVAFDRFGRERPATEEELLREINSPDVKYLEDGSVWVYYYGQKIEITDKFDEKGVCYVQLENGGNTLYMTIKYKGGSCTGTHSYPDPRSFNGGAG